MSLKLEKKLNGISRCSINGNSKVRDLFKVLTNNLELWDMAHQSIASNKGATTRGVDNVTADGHSDERVLMLMESLRNGSYYPKPVRRTYIPKANGKKRPLGIPNYHDKLVQSACKILLESIYEPIFHEESYGFRPKRGCHDALNKIQKKWTGTKWFIEFDIKGYFDNINHDKLMQILSEKIDDDRFLALIRKMLRAGYMEDWQYNKTWSGTPQGGIISPILANIYLDKLDRYVQKLCDQNCYGRERSRNPEYQYWQVRLTRLKALIRKNDQKLDPSDEAGQIERAEKLLKYRSIQSKLMGLRSGDDFDKKFRRLKYCRYADDFVLGFIGSKIEATKIMDKIKEFLRTELLLEVAEEKTKIESHKVGIRFLNYEIRSWAKPFFKKKIVKGVPSYHRYGDWLIYLFVPDDRAKEYCKKKSYGDWTTVKSKHRTYLVNLSDAEILNKYNEELRGFYQYYKIARNFYSNCWKLFYIADYSCRKTLAAKHKSSVKKISGKYLKSTPKGDKKLTVVVPRNGRTYQLVKPNEIDRTINILSDVDKITDFYTGYNDLTKRRKEEICETCGVKTAFVEEHHIRALKDIRKSVSWWDRLMIARNRKTLILCISCHDQIHAGTLPDLRKGKPNNDKKSRKSA
jgi:RNA-directed DNA polymerase